MKNTKQKELILEAVYTLKTHPSADEIYALLRQDHEKLSLGTVYRNLNSFVQQGKIKKISVPDNSDCFDWRVDPHEHLFCEKCGRLFDIDLQLDIKAMIPPDSSAEITNYKLMLYGVCQGCKHL